MTAEREKRKILYLTIGEILSASSGVANKLLTKVRALRGEVDECSYLNATLSVQHDELRRRSIEKGIHELEIGVKRKTTGYLNFIRWDVEFYRVLAEVIAEEYQVDKIIFRYPLAGYGLQRFTKRFRNKIVFEHNAIEIEEVKLLLKKRKVDFSLRPSLFLYWFQEMKWPAVSEKLLAPVALRNAHSGACVTSEIADYQRRRARGYRTFVSSNFYKISDVELVPVEWDARNEKLCMGFIVNTLAPWYGIDRLFRSFAPVQEKYKLILAGIDPNNAQLQEMVEKYKLGPHFICVGRLDQKDLPEFYKQIHLSFGSLAVYRSGVNFASTLKVKESMAYGRPVILGYNEEDLYNNPAFSGYYLQLPNDDSTIDFGAVETFARKFYSVPGNPARLRELAKKTVDVGVKVKALVNHIYFNS